VDNLVSLYPTIITKPYSPITKTKEDIQEPQNIETKETTDNKDNIVHYDYLSDTLFTLDKDHNITILPGKPKLEHQKQLFQARKKAKQSLSNQTKQTDDLD